MFLRPPPRLLSGERCCAAVLGPAPRPGVGGGGGTDSGGSWFWAAAADNGSVVLRAAIVIEHKLWCWPAGGCCLCWCTHLGFVAVHIGQLQARFVQLLAVRFRLYSSTSCQLRCVWHVLRGEQHLTAARTPGLYVLVEHADVWGCTSGWCKPTRVPCVGNTLELNGTMLHALPTLTANSLAAWSEKEASCVWSEATSSRSSAASLSSWPTRTWRRP